MDTWLPFYYNCPPEAGYGYLSACYENCRLWCWVLSNAGCLRKHRCPYTGEKLQCQRVYLHRLTCMCGTADPICVGASCLLRLFGSAFGLSAPCSVHPSSPGPSPPIPTAAAPTSEGRRYVSTGTADPEEDNACRSESWRATSQLPPSVGFCSAEPRLVWSRACFDLLFLFAVAVYYRSNEAGGGGQE